MFISRTLLFYFCPGNFEDWNRGALALYFPVQKTAIDINGPYIPCADDLVYLYRVSFILFIHSVRALRSGIGFGPSKASVKALQKSLSGDSLGGGTDEDGKLPGYGLFFNFHRRGRRTTGHPSKGIKRGMFLGSDKSHEANDEEKCRKRFSGLSSYDEELAEINLNPHEQNHSKTKNPPSLCNMRFDTFTLMTSLINEAENRPINRTTFDLVVRRGIGHSGLVKTCCGEGWVSGRCFCSTPLVRSIDEIGKLRITKKLSV